MSSVTPDVGGLLSGVSNAISIGDLHTTNKVNLDYLKKLQKQIWAREDSAIQRRVKDLEAAGLNKVLAAGQGAQTSPGIKVERKPMPQINSSFGAMDAMNLMTGKAMIDKTEAENEYIKMQTKRLGHDLGIAEKTGTTTTPGGIINTLRNAFGLSHSNTTKGVLSDISSKFSEFKKITNEFDKKHSMPTSKEGSVSGSW